jgi:hypothetical protein
MICNSNSSCNCFLMDLLMELAQVDNAMQSSVRGNKTFIPPRNRRKMVERGESNPRPSGVARQ